MAKVVSFGMESIIEEYKNNKQDRETIKENIWNIIKNKYHSKNKIVNIFAGSVLVLFVILAISVIFKIEFLILITLILFFISIGFKNSQCFYVLNEFNKIEKLEELEENFFKEKIIEKTREDEQYKNFIDNNIESISFQLIHAIEKIERKTGYFNTDDECDCNIKNIAFYVEQIIKYREVEINGSKTYQRLLLSKMEEIRTLEYIYRAKSGDRCEWQIK